MAALDSERPVALVSGSGIDLLPLLDTTEKVRSFSEFPGIASPRVEGHLGEFVYGRVSGSPVIVQRGRLHIYEGHSYDEVVAPLDFLHAQGVRRVLFTNAVGGLRTEMKPGDICAIRSIRLMPFRTWAGCPECLSVQETVAGCNSEGSYAWVHGPSYETKAEIGALQQLECDVVGMSAGPEIHRCETLGISAAVVSLITNNCMDSDVLTHEHVVEEARRGADKMLEIARTFVLD